MHRILFHRNAVKFYRKADDTLKERISDAVAVIAQNPHLDSHIKKLKGDLKHMHRFRMGDLRMLAAARKSQKWRCCPPEICDLGAGMHGRHLFQRAESFPPA